MVMVGQSRRLREPLRWTKAGKATVAVVVALALIAATALAVAISNGSPAKRPGCIAMTFASTVGGATIQACGTKARRYCANPQASPHTAHATNLRSECERANLPYWTSSRP
jgi:hypothetical protein